MKELDMKLNGLISFFGAAKIMQIYRELPPPFVTEPLTADRSDFTSDSSVTVDKSEA